MKNLVRFVGILVVTILAATQARAGVLAQDTFSYSDGNLTTVSGGTWVNYSGAGTDIQVSGGKAVINSANAPDDAIAIGSQSGNILYASFDVNFNSAPTGSGTYFGLFKDASTFNFFARVWASNDVSNSGFVKIGIANQSGTANYDGSLAIGTTYKVVTKLDLTGATPLATMWINPVDELSASLQGTDTPTIAAPTITQFGLREGTASFGTFENIDNLKVGTSFADVVAVPEPSTLVLLGAGLAGLLALRRRS